MSDELKYRRLAHMQSHGLDVGFQECTAIGFRGSELGGSASIDESGLGDAEKCEDCAEISPHLIAANLSLRGIAPRIREQKR